MNTTKLKPTLVFWVVIKVIFLAIALLVGVFLQSLSSTKEASAANYVESDFRVDREQKEVVYNSLEQSFNTSVFYNEEPFSDYVIKYSAAGTEYTEEKPVNVGTYYVRIEINASDIAWTSALIIKPKLIYIRYDGADSYNYTGMPLGRIISPEGVIGGEDLGMKVKYIGTQNQVELGELPIMADLYNIDIIVSNPNYIITSESHIGTSPRIFEIKKIDLRVKGKDIIINPDEKLEFELQYDGFVNNESIANLQRVPQIIFEDKTPNIYKVKPSGGVSNNYSFIYFESQVTINKTEVEFSVENHKITINATFDPEYNFIVDKITEDSPIYKKGMETLKMRKMFKYMDKVIYSFSADNSTGIARDSKYKVHISNIKFNNLFAYKVLIVDPHGLVHEITNFSKSGDTLSFTANSLGTLYVVEKHLRTYLIIGVSVGLVLIVILFIIFTNVKYRLEKKALDEERIKKQKGREYKWR